MELRQGSGPQKSWNPWWQPWGWRQPGHSRSTDLGGTQGASGGEVVQRPIQDNMMLVRPTRLNDFYVFEAPRVT